MKETKSTPKPAFKWRCRVGAVRRVSVGTWCVWGCREYQQEHDVYEVIVDVALAKHLNWANPIVTEMSFETLA